jgi:hypothetical protein
LARRVGSSYPAIARLIRLLPLGRSCRLAEFRWKEWGWTGNGLIA